MPPSGRPPRPSKMVVACYLAYAAIGWFLNGIGAVLPDLELDVGERVAAWYPLMPGGVLLVWGALVVRRQGTADSRQPHAVTVIVSSIGLAAGMAVMGVTRWAAVSVVGGLAAAVATATLVRLLPAVLATVRAGDTGRALMRANAWSSLAAIVAPLAVGTSIALGGGWLTGFLLPVALAAGLVAITARPEPGEQHAAPAATASVPVPPLSRWWRPWAVLVLCIVVEFCFSYYSATYLHDERGLSTAAAAAGAAAWGLGMTVGRFVVSTWPPPRTVVPSVGLIAVGFALLWFVPSSGVAIAGIGVAGFGASPLYPIRITALLERFPGSPDHGAARGSVASGAALLAAPALMASLRAATDVRTAYLAVPVLLAVLLLLAGSRTERGEIAFGAGDAAV